MSQNVDVDISWKSLESSVQERERVSSNLRRELASLEKLSGQTVAALAQYAARANHAAMSPPAGVDISPCWSSPISPGSPMLAAPGARGGVQLVFRSYSTPQLSEKSNPNNQNISNAVTSQRPKSGHLPQWPQRNLCPNRPVEAVQTPPCPRPLVHL